MSNRYSLESRFFPDCFLELAVLVLLRMRTPGKKSACRGESHPGGS